MLGKIPANRLRLIEGVVSKATAVLNQELRRGGVNAKSAALLKPLLPTFIRAYYRGVSEDDLAGRKVDELAGAAIWHLKAGFKRQPGTPWVHVCNPTAEQEGFQSPHTVVAVVCDDMPFLVDSITMALNQAELSLLYLAHPILAVERDRAGRLISVLEEPTANSQYESWQFLEIDQELNSSVLDSLEIRLHATLSDVRAAVADWPTMRSRARQIASSFAAEDRNKKDAEGLEIRDLLEWMDDGYFTFLGYREYKLKRGKTRDELLTVATSGLGILRVPEGIKPAPTTLDGTVRERARSSERLIITKANSISTVHRAQHLDYVGIKILNKKGEVTGEHRFLGLWTSSAYNLNPRDMPVLRRKLAKVIAHFGLSSTSHDGKELINVLEDLPRIELFQASINDLIRLSRGIVNLYERQQVRLFIRRDEFERFYSCLIYLPRDRYNATIKSRLEAVMSECLRGNIAESNAKLSSSALARLHVLVRTPRNEVLKPESRSDIALIEARLTAATLTWADGLAHALTSCFDADKARQLTKVYAGSLPLSYQADTPALEACRDIVEIEQLRGASAPSRMRMHRPVGTANSKAQLKIYRAQKALAVSDILPTLENLGLRLISERPYEITEAGKQSFWIQDFELEHAQGLAIDIPTDGPRLIETINAVGNNLTENDGFNRLILGADLSWRETAVVRAYCRWLLQTGIPFSQPYMESVLSSHPKTTGRIYKLFATLFDPTLSQAVRARDVTAIQTSIDDELTKIVRIDDDRILRSLRAAVDATLRTNFFQLNDDLSHRATIAFKLNPAKLPDLPEPKPMFEIWVYSPRVEAVHLRKGKVSRGGLRWSDRFEDFRTEVLGLMKAQNVKNTVIVPVGAKGGFVCKRLPSIREAIAAEVVACYSEFISAMLEITDNVVDGKVVPPLLTVRRDPDDPYLVVAADKGTATFSDTANAISERHGFWLGDAFASGGSAGYDHKKIAITARGAWECVKRHFRDFGRDIQKQPFTVAGIGDMSGDVFGNGMLQSPQIHLVAAFNHQHIFIDPKPDPVRSFAERERLFALPRSSWDDYSRKTISAGGGVWSRQEKTLSLPREARALLGLTTNTSTPTEVIQAILKLDVDLLWNGGIGTYVKASSESHSDVGDRSNDALRIDGKELRAKVVGEGGNLGLSQLGRVEYAMCGGRLNTDFIDNSAGVNCSDLEVNIKILLGAAARQKGLKRAARDKLLAAMTDDVSSLVLRNNYLQSQALSVLQSRSGDRASEHAFALRILERSGELDRHLENLPADDELRERIAKGQYLTRPELSMVLSYSKIWLYNQLIRSDVPEDSYLANELTRYFPDALHKRYADLFDGHPLKREIIATATTNSLINRMGPVFALRAIEDTGAGVGAIARAYSAARESSLMRELWSEIEALDNRIAAGVQYEMHYQTTRFLRHATYWLLLHRPLIDINQTVSEFQPGLAELEKHALMITSGRVAERIQGKIRQAKEAGVPERLAKQMASLEILYSGLDIVDVSRLRKMPIIQVAQAYFHIGDALDLDWLRTQIDTLAVDGHWQAVARNTLRESLYVAQRNLTDAALKSSKSGDAIKGTESWLAARRFKVEALKRILREMESIHTLDFATLSVGLQSVRRLLQG